MAEQGDDGVPAERMSVGMVSVRFGRDVRVVEPVNLYGCEIGDGCFIGPFVEIQKNVTIGRRCRVQSHAFICERVTMGDDCFVSHGAKFVNDLFRDGAPSHGGSDTWLPTVVGDRVSIGTNATILPVRICSDAVVGAGAVVTHDIVSSGIYAGNPARKIRDLKVGDDR